MFIDSHCHIYSQEFHNDMDAVFTRAGQASIDKILMPAIDSETHISMMSLEQLYPEVCISMMGLHPCSVNTDFESELLQVEKHLLNRKFIAIGETGLDFYWDLTYQKEQYIAFKKQAEWAIQYHIPLVIHSRNATDECITVVKEYVDQGLTGVFHCFGGSLEQAKKITDLGFYLGIGGVLTFKKSGLDIVLQEIDMRHIILETDAPYLAPVPYRGKRNEPAYIPLIAQKLADVKQMSIEDIAGITTSNAQKLFNI